MVIVISTMRYYSNFLGRRWWWCWWHTKGCEKLKYLYASMRVFGWLWKQEDSSWLNWIVCTSTLHTFKRKYFKFQNNVSHETIRNNDYFVWNMKQVEPFMGKIEKWQCKDEEVFVGKDWTWNLRFLVFLGD